MTQKTANPEGAVPEEELDLETRGLQAKSTVIPRAKALASV